MHRQEAGGGLTVSNVSSVTIHALAHDLRRSIWLELRPAIQKGMGWMNVKFLSVAGVVVALGLSVPALGQNNPPLRTGFPLFINGGGTPYGQTVVADLKWPAPYDQYKSIIFTSWNQATSQAWLYVVRFNGTSASVPAPFPIAMPTLCAGNPAVGDLDNDGVPEIVVPYGSQYRDNFVGGVRAYRRDGTQMWDYPSSNNPPSCCGADFPYGVVGSPAIADVDGDGFVEVAWGSFDGKVYLVDGRTGANKAGWPIFVGDTIWSSPVLFDLDGDGKKEVIISVDDGPQNGGTLHVFRHDGTGGGAPGMVPVPELPGFPIDYDQALYSAPAVGDIDGDGKPEIVFGTSTFYGNPAPCGSGIPPLRARRVYAVKCDGSSVPGWPVTTDGEVRTTPALADVDLDGIVDVVATDIDCSTGTPKNFKVYGFKGTGLQLFKATPLSFSGVNLNAGDPVVADVLGDGKPEILVPTNTEIAVFTNTGTQLTHSTGFSPPPPPGVSSFYTPTSVSGAVVSSMKVSPSSTDPVDVIVVSASDFPTASNTQVTVWNPKMNPLPAPTWGMVRQNPARTAVVPGTLSCTAVPPVATKFYVLSPCRAFDTRNPAGQFGGPAIGASSSRTFDLAGICGIPSDAKSISINATVVNPPAAGFLVLYPAGMGRPSSSTINFWPGQTRANNALIRLSSDGLAGLVVTNGSPAPTDVVVDVSGYFK